MSIQIEAFASGLANFLRISCMTTMLLILGACNSGGGGNNTPPTSDGTGSGATGGTGSGATGGTGSDGSNSGSSSNGNDGTVSGDPATGGGTGTKSTSTIKFFAADDGVHGIELWKTDGTAEGTVLVKDINAAADSSPTDFTELNGAFYFQTDDGVHGRELWKTDGTADGTVLVKDINPTSGESSTPTGFTLFNHALYFSANDGVHGVELWKTDGTAEGTVLVKDIDVAGAASSYPPGPHEFTVFNGELFFNTDDGTHGPELWKTNGTAEGTILVKDINPMPGEGSNPAYFTGIGSNGAGALYFSASDGVNGIELWKTDGTPAGTTLVKNINTTADSNPYGLGEINNAFYFAANDGINGNELWKTDGTAAGTVLVKDIHPGKYTTGEGADSNPSVFSEFKGAFYFSANDGVHGVELWKTDGTAEGTALVKDINTTATYGDPGSNPRSFTSFRGELYFSANDSVNGGALWKTDGTAAGTILVKDINTSNPRSDSSLHDFTPFSEALYFQASDSVHGNEAWKTDGTTEGTQLLKDICLGRCDGARSIH